MHAVYTTWGSVRGGCRHLHRIVAAVEACLDKDHRGCQRQGGYSDRTLLVSDADGIFHDRQGHSYHPYGPTCSALSVSDVRDGRR